MTQNAPSDTELLIFREGDGDVMGQPSGGAGGHLPTENYEPLPHHVIPIYRQFSFLLTAGSQLTLDLNGDVPDAWIVSLSNTANSQLRIWVGRGAGSAADALTIDATGKATIPGIQGGSALTLISSGAATASVSAIAQRGYPQADVTRGSS